MNRSRIALAAVLAAASVMVGTAQASPPPQRAVPAGPAAGSGEPLMDAAGPIAVDALRADAQSLQASADDLSDLAVRDVVPLGGSDVTVVYVQQRVDGIDIHNAITSVAVAADGSVAGVANRLVTGVARRITGPTTPTLRPAAAARAALEAVDLVPTERLTVIDPPSGADQQTELSDGGVTDGTIPAALTYVLGEDGALRLSWNVQVDVTDAPDIWQVRVDAATGKELDRNNLTVNETFVESQGTAVALPSSRTAAGGGVASALPASGPAEGVADGSSYLVYAFPTEAPSFGGRTTVSNPADPTASPFGWHDTNGAGGPESTLTQGNNVHAYIDADLTPNAPDPGSEADGGAGLDFAPPLDLMLPPSSYRPAAVTNLFYANNTIHDILYSYGFDERSGNFQLNNYGRGGQGNDAVNAEAQDGGGTNNANFATPQDGFAPRMQMYVWTAPTPDRDGDLDNGVIAHEYGHGVSNRLTGGPSAVSCLSNEEQMGEGVSDFFAYMLTFNPASPTPTSRGIGTYVLNQPTTGMGIRTAPYSTDSMLNPWTYDTIKSPTAIPHGVGAVWAEFLWEARDRLIAKHGFDPDLIGGTGGNNILMQLVMDGLKLQPCAPGFIDARDGILLADRLDYDGANQCVLWQAFAERGLGYSALQGSPFSRADGTQAFDVPPECNGLDVQASFSAATTPAIGSTVPEIIGSNRTGAPLTDVVLSAPVPTDSAVRAGSARCAGGLTGSVAMGVITFDIGTLPAASSIRCTATLDVMSDTSTTTLFSDNFDSGLVNWQTTHELGITDWVATSSRAVSGQSAFAANSLVTSVLNLATASSFVVGPTTQLLFTHYYATEWGYDGGVVEVSSNGGMTWDAVPVTAMSARRYSNALGADCPAPGFSGRHAFSGYATSFETTTVDLSAWSGNSVRVRFRLANDCLNAVDGWYVDNVVLRNVVNLSTTATASTSSMVPTATDTATSLLTAPQCDGRAVTVKLGLGQSPTAGNDVIMGTVGNDVINAGGGNDTVCSGPGNDVVNGGSGNDRILAAAGKDRLIPGPGNDSLMGGFDTDTLDLRSVGGSTNLTVNLQLTSAQATGQGADSFALVENVFGGHGDDVLTGSVVPNTITGGDGDDTLVGAKGNDVINGGDGDDVIQGGLGNDTLNGQADIDTLSYDLSLTGVNVSLGAPGGTTTVTPKPGGTTGLDQVSNFEDVRGSAAPDTIVGNSVANELTGLAGNDDLSGGGAGDRLFGSSGNDDLAGGSGSDLCSGSTGVDTATGCETVNGVP